NTEVKLLSADGSWGFPPVRVGRRRAHERTAVMAVLFLCMEKDLLIIFGNHFIELVDIFVKVVDIMLKVIDIFKNPPIYPKKVLDKIKKSIILPKNHIHAPLSSIPLRLIARPVGYFFIKY
uniref:hypothetical protein n=1 Tax=Mesobacillus jeotgali TaxID=129985 RepID=UPI001C5A1D35